MKNLIFTLFAIWNCSIVFAQVNDCPEPKNSIEIGEKIQLEFIPDGFTEDIWGEPIFDDAVPVDRLVIWVHGLSGQGDDAGGTEISWLKASTSTEENYYVNSRRPDYNDASLFDAAAELKGDIEIEYGDDVDENTFIIAHSQGGIVSRRIDQAYETGELGLEPRTFHGLVTFGTPHQGAQIINNIDQFEPWIMDACISLSEGPLAEFENLTIFGEILSLFVNLEDLKNYFCNTLTPVLLSRVSENMAAPISSDYAVGAAELNALNSFTPTIPYVCFYGVETEPLMWNTIVHLLDGHLPNDAEVFMANNDESLKTEIENLIDEYYLKYVEWKEEYQMWEDYYDGWGKVIDWIPFVEVIVNDIIIYNNFTEAESIMDGWLNGFQWLADANPTWKSIIGADIYTWVPDAFCQCLFYDGPLEDEITIELEPGEECEMAGADECNNIGAYVIYTLPSDGVVLAASAGNVPGLTHSKVMTDSNHFSMRNDHNTEDRLADLFDGEYCDFFITELR